MRGTTIRRLLATTACAALALAAAPASAQSGDREQQLERRVQELEAALAAIRADMAADRAAGRSRMQDAETRAAAATAASDQAAAKVAELERKASAPFDGLRMGATTIKISGFVKTDAMYSRYSGGDTATNTLGRDFYLPSSIPVGGAPGGEKADFDAHAKQTRIWITTATPVGDHAVGTHIEGDFQSAPGTQGSERTTNAYNFALRRAFLTVDSWTFGQDWSTFQHVAALPETADFIGPTEGAVFVREAQIRYQRKLSAGLTLAVALENPETATILPGSAALIENDDDSLPDLTAKLVWKPGAAELSLAGVLRQLSDDTATASATATGYGLSLAGKVPFGPRHQHDIRFGLTGGKGIGRYLGLNFAPDAVFVTGPGGARLDTVGLWGGYAAVRYFLTDRVRVNLMGSIQDVDNPASAPAAANARAWSAATNVFYSPAKGLDLGVEYRHGERKLVNGQSGDLDRLHVVAKQSF